MSPLFLIKLPNPRGTEVETIFSAVSTKGDKVSIVTNFAPNPEDRMLLGHPYNREENTAKLDGSLLPDNNNSDVWDTCTLGNLPQLPLNTAILEEVDMFQSEVPSISKQLTTLGAQQRPDLKFKQEVPALFDRIAVRQDYLQRLCWATVAMAEHMNRSKQRIDEKIVELSRCTAWLEDPIWPSGHTGIR
ncbi:hypothetical protein M231_06583 [Tremella mesenterica]|uniref:Uncharacterized protein n=1 Tax=Tremella mesenterica TaxID=5217 RepID=A0A4Q1BG53_TREME|nr:hypothetical protein M231_06583 [Tremella mesenterica]